MCCGLVAAPLIKAALCLIQSRFFSRCFHSQRAIGKPALGRLYAFSPIKPERQLSRDARTAMTEPRCQNRDAQIAMPIVLLLVAG